MTVNYEDLGKRIRRKRSENHISQAALAEMIQVSVQHMSNVENAKTKASLETVIEIANALDCSLDELVCGSLKKQSRQIYQDEVALLLEVMPDRRTEDHAGCPEKHRLYLSYRCKKCTERKRLEQSCGEVPYGCFSCAIFQCVI